MTPLVTSAVLLAAVTHAGWNAIAHKITDKLVGFTLIAGGGVLIGLVLMPFGTFPAAPQPLGTSCANTAANTATTSGAVPRAMG